MDDVEETIHNKPLPQKIIYLYRHVYKILAYLPAPTDY